MAEGGGSLNLEDTFTVECGRGLSEDALISLFTLYQPIASSAAVSLYMTLRAEGTPSLIKNTLKRLCTTCGMSISGLEDHLIRLEQCLLLRTYRCEQGSHVSFIFEPIDPLSVKSFLNSDAWMEQLCEVLGSEELAGVVEKYSVASNRTDEYKDVTHPVRYRTRGTKFDRSLKLQDVHNALAVDQLDDISFNYERFINLAGTMYFPVEQRDAETMHLIGKLGTVFGLSPEKMWQNVVHSMKNDRLDKEILQHLCEISPSDPRIVAQDPYDLPPVAFLQSLQNGKNVSLTDRKILEYLALEMDFSNPVINVMIEYILKRSNNRLVRTFVQMVAGEWARDHVTTKEQALQVASKSIASSRSGRKQQDVLPDYYYAEHEEKQASAEQLKQLEEMLKAQGGGHGKD